MGSNELGSVIRKLRKERDLSQERLGALCGLNHSTISLIENGKTKSPPAYQITSIAKALGVSPNTLLVAAGLMNDTPKRPETPQEILHRLKLATPTAIPVYDRFNEKAGGQANIVDYVYSTGIDVSKSRLEAYLVDGKLGGPSVQGHDIVIVDRDMPVNPGDFVAGSHEGEFFVGRVRAVEGIEWVFTNSKSFRLSEAIVCPVLQLIRNVKKPGL